MFQHNEHQDEEYFTHHLSDHESYTDNLCCESDQRSFTDFFSQNYLGNSDITIPELQSNRTAPPSPPTELSKPNKAQNIATAMITPIKTKSETPNFAFSPFIGNSSSDTKFMAGINNKHNDPEHIFDQLENAGPNQDYFPFHLAQNHALKSDTKQSQNLLKKRFHSEVLSRKILDDISNIPDLFNKQISNENLPFNGNSFNNFDKKTPDSKATKDNLSQAKSLKEASGLKALSAKVKKIFKKIDNVSYKQVCEALIAEEFVAEDQKKNLYRRVYDAQNVLIATNVLKKDSGKVSLHKIDLNKLAEKRNSFQKKKLLVTQKKENLTKSIRKLIALKNMVKKNSVSEEPERILHCVTVATPSKTGQGVENRAKTEIQMMPDQKKLLLFSNEKMQIDFPLEFLEKSYLDFNLLDQKHKLLLSLMEANPNFTNGLQNNNFLKHYQ